MQEQLLSKVTELDYEIISDIDIRNDAYQVVSFCPGVENMMPKKRAVPGGGQNDRRNYYG